MKLTDDESSRLLPFKRVANFRDLGGYPAADGRTVRWGALYRSGHLAKMKRRDKDLFVTLGIDTVIDLRSDYERKRAPNRLPAQDPPKVLELSILDEANAYMRKEI
ncbi:MAG TPA: tyrosine-protein phosphatase, partial [Anaerolineales bacterium]|nr:tyrosine-protein phosphatase [Anaerolineales bacterium]